MRFSCLDFFEIFCSFLLRFIEAATRGILSFRYIPVKSGLFLGYALDCGRLKTQDLRTGIETSRLDVSTRQVRVISHLKLEITG